MRRRGAALWLVVLAELVLPAGGVAPRLFRASAFVPRLFDSALIRCPHAPTRTHDFSRVPMGSHLTPIARI